MQIDEIKEHEEGEEDFNLENTETGDTHEEKDTGGKPQFRFKSKKLIIIPIILVMVALAFIIKGLFFKPQTIKLSSFQSKPIINKSGKFLISDLSETSGNNISPSGKNLSKNAVKPVLRNRNSEPQRNKAARHKRINRASTNTQGAASNFTFKVPAISSESMKSVLKFNTEINKLKEQAQIAQLRQQIKTLANSSTIAGGINPGNPNNVSLVGISKNQAIVKFGKTDVTMSVGSSYDGYTCLMIKNTGIVLEKGNKAINLNFSM
ncbi:MAG: hypothetical protein M0016_02450 [Deltaproteobacteria bacterium]|jgi:hypothetical protein|nr:hypothetical protein [Deltaproteobacteria bacterium]MDA8304008.1 hypothetical protein [Deltaproteobacteria bacterium]